MGRLNFQSMNMGKNKTWTLHWAFLHDKSMLTRLLETTLDIIEHEKFDEELYAHCFNILIEYIL